MNEISEITLLLQRWLAKNNISAKDVRVIVEFPKKAEAYHAQASLKQEMVPVLVAFADVRKSVAEGETMNGIFLSFSNRT